MPGSWTQFVGTFTTPSTITAPTTLSFTNNTLASGEPDELALDDVVVEVAPQPQPQPQPQSQSIAFAQPPSPITYAPGESFPVDASSSSGLPVSFSVGSGDPCSVSGSTVTVTGAGSCNITATQEGNDTYTAAAPVTKTVLIGLASQSITFPAPDPASITYGQPGPQLAATSDSGLPVAYSASGPCTVTSDGHVFYSSAGQCDLIAFQEGNANYAPAAPKDQMLTINQASQSISFPPLTGGGYGQTPPSPAASSSSGLPVSYSSATPQVCLVTSGGTITEKTPGTCTIAADQAGNADYSAAAQVTQSFTIGPAPDCAPFTDVNSTNPFCLDIAWAKAHGIALGNTDGSFGPTVAVSRAAMAAFLYRDEHPNDPAPACTVKPYSDVATSNPFCGDIAALKAEGIIRGNADGTYSPNTSVNRAQMAAFLYRLANPGAPAPACTTAPFRDVATSSTFCGDIAWLADHQVVQGYPDGTYRPSTVVARQEMTAFLHRLAQLS